MIHPLKSIDHAGVLPKDKIHWRGCNQFELNGYNASNKDHQSLAVDIDWDKRTVRLVRVG